MTSEQLAALGLDETLACGRKQLATAQLAALGFEQRGEDVQDALDTMFGVGGSERDVQELVDTVFGDGGSWQDIRILYNSIFPCVTYPKTSNVSDIVPFYTRDCARD